MCLCFFIILISFYFNFVLPMLMCFCHMFLVCMKCHILDVVALMLPLFSLLGASKVWTRSRCLPWSYVLLTDYSSVGLWHQRWLLTEWWRSTSNQFSVKRQTQNESACVCLTCFPVRYIPHIKCQHAWLRVSVISVKVKVVHTCDLKLIHLWTASGIRWLWLSALMFLTWIGGWEVLSNSS